MRSPDERAAERAKHKKVEDVEIDSGGRGDGCLICLCEDPYDAVHASFPCPTIIAMDETDEALAELEKEKRVAENWETWANHHECGGML